MNWDFISGISHGGSQVGRGRQSRYGENLYKTQNSDKRVFTLLFPVIKGFTALTGQTDFPTQQ